MEIKSSEASRLSHIIFGILILSGLYFTTFYNFLLFHSIAEVFIIIVVCGIFMVAWHSRRFLDNNYLLFMGIAYIFVAVLELIHTLAYSGMGIFKGYGPNLPTQLWIAARYLESLSLLVAPLFFGCRLKLNAMFVIYASVTSLILLSIFLWDIFPPCFIEGTGLTLFKKISEYIICLIYIGSITLLFQKQKEFDKGVYQLLIWSILFSICAELAFTFYVHVYGISNLIGHYFAIISFYLIYKAIIETGLVKPYDLLFRNLKQSENKFRLLADHTFDWEYWVDPDGKFIYLSPSCERITGYSPKEFISDPQLIFKIVRSDYAEKFYHHYIDEGKEDSPFFSMEFPIITKTGEEVWLDHHCRPVYDDQGNYTGRRGNNRDITDRKRTEEEKVQLEAQYRQAQKMESVGCLAGGVAHDYNNALTTIMGFTELAMMDADPKGSLHSDLNQVLKAGRRARDITRQLLAFARKQTIAPKVLDLNQDIESVLKMIRRLIGEDIDLVWFPVKNLWPVKMDPSQVDQILANLCVNARDAIEGVGKITIESDMVVLDADYCSDHAGFIPGEFVLLSISDNGCGMDKKTLNKVFEPFFTTKAVDKGTGLGLSTVYGIVKQNNGFINVYSEPGKGTTIKIYLPRHDGKVDKIQEKSTAKTPQGHGETILLVEDDMPILKLAEKILTGLNYKVLIADTPKEAMRLAKEYTDKIHLLVADVVMPGMNGLELANNLQSLYPDLKRIFMSGYTANAIAHHGVLEDGVHFIQKPFSKIDLATIVRKVLDEKKS